MALLLKLDRLTRHFGKSVALDAVSLELPTGLVGLLGPNGAGKSTLLKLLMGLIPPTSGDGWVLDQPLGGDRDGQSNWQLRRLIGFMPEAEALVPGLSGVEYVALAGELYGMHRKQALRRAHEVLSYVELEEARYRKVEDYSAGMKQRVKLGQALVHDPPVLLLDEPTSGLDPAGRDAMLNLIRELGTDHGKSVILSTHLLADVRAVCERVVILAAGKIRAVGTVSEVCAPRSDRYRVAFLGNRDRFERELAKRGADVQSRDETQIVVTVPSHWQTNEFFGAATSASGAIRSLAPHEETLQEFFLRNVASV